VAFFQQAGYSIVEMLVIVFSFLGLGILIEVAFRRISNIPSPSNWNRIFNCKCTAVLVVLQGSVELILFMPVYWLAFKIEAFSHGPFFRLRSGIPFALLVALLLASSEISFTTGFIGGSTPRAGAGPCMSFTMKTSM
jgi:hypothetical protein